MKIGVLTLPLHANYGGNLQVWALMTALKDMGHDAWLIDRHRNHISWWRLPLELGKRAVLKYGARRPGVSFRKNILDRKERELYELHSARFIAEHLAPSTEQFHSTRQIRDRIKQHQFDAIIVGSDQVWRREYAPNIQDYFLGFLPEGASPRRISYAASFGTDKWRLTPAQTQACSKLLKKFDAVSVRESSGIRLCREYLGADAVHVLDPTMLLDAERYLQLLPEKQPPAQKLGRLFTYLLDNEPVKLQALERIAQQTRLTPTDVTGRQVGDMLSKPATAPPVENWIRGFRDAEFVFTDSFHGCVFSILFNKPFVAIGNPKRGLARFESLLEMFGLKNRLVISSNEVTADLLNAPIDWNAVNRVLHDKRQSSVGFLASALAGV
ncbi:polysaccharide pyruvyl transferase family protein [Hydrocarboniphaga effusa]|uniref:polysaccharide pyruvyl transferase family protein n=1 Tax=Hydrocarboniphaga effusa TaxID=243629 RepID=UPI00398BC0CA